MDCLKSQPIALFYIYWHKCWPCTLSFVCRPTQSGLILHLCVLSIKRIFKKKHACFFLVKIEVWMCNSRLLRERTVSQSQETLHLWLLGGGGGGGGRGRVLQPPDEVKKKVKKDVSHFLFEYQDEVLLMLMATRRRPHHSIAVTDQTLTSHLPHWPSMMLEANECSWGTRGRFYTYYKPKTLCWLTTFTSHPRAQ